MASQVDKQIGGLTDSVQTLSDKVKELEKGLHSKVDCETFDEEIQSLKSLIALLSSGGDNKQAITQVIQSSMSSKELSKIKELAAKVQELEDMLNKLLRDMKTLNLNELREQIADAHRKLSLKASTEELETAKTELSEDYNKKIDALKPLLDKFKHLEMAVNDNKDNIYKHDFRVRYYWVYTTSLS